MGNTEKSGEQGRSFKLAILIPSGDQWDADFSLSLLQMQRFMLMFPVVDDFDFTIINERGSLIAMQRENMVSTALSDETVTHLLFLDSDMSFPPNLFNLLLKHDLPIVACNYVKRGIPSMPNTRAVTGKLIGTSKGSIGLEEADSAGFGAVLIRREVFENTPKPWFDTVWLDKGDRLEMMGEDVFFFRKARQVGHYPLFIDHDASQKIGHIGSYTYENWMCETTWDEMNLPGYKQETMA